MRRRTTSRRAFLKGTAAAGFGFWVSARSVYSESKSPNEKLNIGVIGCGGKGASDTDAVASQNIVALCDVDEDNAKETFKKYPNAKKYKDFRKMLEEEKSLDAVIVATPDHVHAPAGIMAMKLGKHLYCQKPLTHSVYEARRMREVAREMKVATQMGNQGTAETGLRRGCEVLRSGAIGAINEVHVWSNRPIWPQGIERPSGSDPIPPYLDWDLWLGPAPERPYKGGKTYCPFNWRGWWDFGTGALGDMACHTANLPFKALELEHPTSIQAESSGVNKETAPKWSRIVFQFPARKGRETGAQYPAVKFVWYDGGQLPSEDLTKDIRGMGRRRKKDKDQGNPETKVPASGCLIIGSKGKLFSPDDYGSQFHLLPTAEFEDYKGPAESIPRSPGHYQEWMRACKGGEPAMSNFEYAALLTETILLGNLSVRANGVKVEWDGPNLKVTNSPEAAQFVKREYRKGYVV